MCSPTGSPRSRSCSSLPWTTAFPSTSEVAEPRPGGSWTKTSSAFRWWKRSTSSAMRSCWSSTSAPYRTEETAALLGGWTASLVAARAGHARRDHPEDARLLGALHMEHPQRPLVHGAHDAVVHEQESARHLRPHLDDGRSARRHERRLDIVGRRLLPDPAFR